MDQQEVRREAVGPRRRRHHHHPCGSIGMQASSKPEACYSYPSPDRPRIKLLVPTLGQKLKLSLLHSHQLWLASPPLPPAESPISRCDPNRAISKPQQRECPCTQALHLLNRRTGATLHGTLHRTEVFAVQDKFCLASAGTLHHACRCPCVLFVRLRASAGCTRQRQLWKGWGLPPSPRP